MNYQKVPFIIRIFLSPIVGLITTVLIVHALLMEGTGSYIGTDKDIVQKWEKFIDGY